MMAPGAFSSIGDFSGRFLPARKSLPGGREVHDRDGRPVPAPGTSQEGGSGREVALVDPVGRVRRGWLSTSPPGNGPSKEIINTNTFNQMQKSLDKI